MPTRPTRTADDDPDAPEWWRSSAWSRRLPFVLLIVLVVVVVHAASGGKAPPITKSCTTPDFALSVTTATQHHEVEYSATGPAGMNYLLYVGVSGFTSTGNQLVATPDPGHTRAQIQPASQRNTMPGSCVQTGHFGVLVPPGTYQVRLFRLEGPSDNVQPVAVASHQLVVKS